MASEPPSIARIRLARSLPRLLGLPVLGLLAGGAAIAGAFLLRLGPPGIVLGAAGAIVVLLAVATAAVLHSVRVEIEDAVVRVRRLGGERRHELVRGPVTRVRLRGPNASSLRSRNRLPGWQLGRARLRDDEDIDVIRLAPTPTAIIVPTDRGRLVIAAHDEAGLLEALSSAARARQHRETIAAAVEAPPVPEAPPEPPIPPAPMTGIERARREALEAAEREALEAAEREALDAGRAAEPATAETTPAAPERPGEVAAMPPLAQPQRARRGLTLGRPPPSAALVLLPLVGAGVALGLGIILDSLPELETDTGRLTAVALVLAGPVATVGAIMARVWWPRLVGVVVAGALAAAVFVGRSLIGA